MELELPKFHLLGHARNFYGRRCTVESDFSDLEKPKQAKLVFGSFDDIQEHSFNNASYRRNNRVDTLKVESICDLEGHF